MYAYDRWATDRILAAAEGLGEEQLNAPGVAGQGSIRDTLLHMIEAQRRWLTVWQGDVPAAEGFGFRLDRTLFPDIATVRTEWHQLASDVEAYCATLTDERCAGPVVLDLARWQSMPVALWQFLYQIANHGTQHRSEVASMLTGYGYSPGGLDFMFFVRERGQTGG
jgi:uncharacterized damage-inducible protein DinB